MRHHPDNVECFQGAGLETRGARLVLRRLTLTPAALLERHTDTYEVAERRQLQAIAALVRFQTDPQLLCVEWTDGLPASAYKTAARDDLLSALLNAAQVSARPRQPPSLGVVPSSCSMMLLLTSHPACLQIANL